MPSNPSGRLTSVFGRVDRLWAACAFVAAVLVFVGAQLPFWRMEMHAPQYPQGLELVAYGWKMEGDLEEVNALNHYVGISPINPDDLLELQLFPYAAGALVIALLLGTVLARHWVLRAGLAAGAWAMAIGFLVDLQIWLYRTGHSLQPDAPMRMDDFTPKVVGRTQVMNFVNESMVIDGFWMIVAAAIVVTFGPMVIRFLLASWRNTGGAQTPSGESKADGKATPDQSAA